MNALERVFGRTKVVLPVIHPITESIALSSIATAVECGADGIFLIDQGMSVTDLLCFIPKVHSLFPDLWIGVNFLGRYLNDTFYLVRNMPVKGIWSDNAQVNEHLEQQVAPEDFRRVRLEAQWPGLYFGGVAFKYQRPVADEDLPIAADKARPFMDVITTSGDGTGISAPVNKVRAMRLGCGAHPMGLASGVDPENVLDFLPYVDAFLVATGIETAKYSGILVPEKTKSLVEAVHNWAP